MIDRLGKMAPAKAGLAMIGLALTALPLSQLTAQTEAAAPAPAVTAAVDPATLAKGKELFANWSCGACHGLADAGAAGGVGPNFDGDPNLTKEFVVGRVTNGQGAMPAFGGQMTDEEIATIATYLVSAAKKG